MKCRKIIKEYAGKDTEPEYTRCNYTVNPDTGICNGCGYEHVERALLTDLYMNKKRQLQERE